MTHFGRFRLINDTPEPNPSTVVHSTYSLPTHPVQTAVGPGTAFPLLPRTFYVDSEPEGEHGDLNGVKVSASVTLDNGQSVQFNNLEVAPNDPLWSLTIRVFREGGNQKAQALVTAWSYKFHETNKVTFT